MMLFHYPVPINAIFGSHFPWQTRSSKGSLSIVKVYLVLGCRASRGLKTGVHCEGMAIGIDWLKGGMIDKSRYRCLHG